MVEEGNSALIKKAAEALYLQALLNEDFDPTIIDGAMIEACLSESNEPTTRQHFGEWEDTKRFLSSSQSKLRQFILAWCDRGPRDATRKFIDPSLILDPLLAFGKSLDFGEFTKFDDPLSNQIFDSGIAAKFQRFDDIYNISLTTLADEISELKRQFADPNLVKNDLVGFLESIDRLCRILNRHSPNTLLERIQNWEKAKFEADHLLNGKGAWKKNKLSSAIATIETCFRSNSALEGLRVSSSLDAQDTRKIGRLIYQGSSLIKETQELFEFSDTNNVEEKINTKTSNISTLADSIILNLKLLKKVSK